MECISRSFIGLLLAVLLAACAGGITRTTVNGETTYYQDGNEVSQEQVAEGKGMFAQQTKEDKQQKKFQEALGKAPRRGASEPVSIALLDPVVAPGPKVDKKKLEQYWRTSFENKKKLPLVSQKDIDKITKSKRNAEVDRDWFVRAQRQEIPGDVYVQLVVKTEAVMARNTKTKKTGLVNALVYSAEIASPYLDERIVLEETVLNIFQNVEQLNQLAARVQQEVKTKLRPKLPSARWIKKQKSTDLSALF
jgi:hypothetical protein